MCIDFILNWRLNLFEIVTQSHQRTPNQTADINTDTDKDNCQWAMCHIPYSVCYMLFVATIVVDTAVGRNM